MRNPKSFCPHIAGCGIFSREVSRVKKGCSAAGGGCRSPGTVRQPAWAFGNTAGGSHDSGTWKPRFLALQPKNPLRVFPAAGLFRLMQPPASLPHIVPGSGWRMSPAKNSLAGKKMPLGTGCFYKLLCSYKGRRMGGKEFSRCILQAKRCARARHGWQGLVTWSSEAPLCGPGLGCQQRGGCS